MEGTYFFGEHLRWNLGWSNPNQAGAFVAMWIPWLWALGASKARVTGWTVFAFEIALWFLLCKTYSRGALVAVAAGGLFYLLQQWLADRSRGQWKMALVRGVAVAIILLATGFFERIDPAFVSRDASAGNRLTLWKGGLQMIAVAPWDGWGSGTSGTAFMHWFQPLEADEAYAGMVNSYLHVGVERGLPVLGLVLATVFAVLMLSVLAAPHGRVAGRIAWFQRAGWAAGASLMVFVVANFFSTLWIFANLWWLPAVAVIGAVAAGIRSARWHWLKLAAISLAAVLPSSAAICGGLWWAGVVIPETVRIDLKPDGEVVCQAIAGPAADDVWILPDPSVLGGTWGKEVRRLALAHPSLRFRIPSPSSSSSAGRRTIIACGKQAEEILATAPDTPGVDLILVHPSGKPPVAAPRQERVSLVLPMLDTHGSGRRWNAHGRRQGWKSITSPGVGHDVRLVWPGILDDFLREAPPSSN